MKSAEHDAYQMYVPFLDFLVRFGMYPDSTIEEFKKLVAKAGCSRAEEAAIGQFLAQLQHIRSEEEREDVL